MRRGLAVAAALWAAASAVPFAWVLPGLPPVGALPAAEGAVQDAAMLLSGARRLGGDAAFIQLLQYLSPEEHDHDHEAGEDHTFSRLLPLSLRCIRLGPYFHSAALFSASVLGFLMHRPDQAVALLQEAAGRDPTFYPYRLYAGGLAYKDSADPEKVVLFLEEALKFPDCPSLLANILANLHKKLGNYHRAAEVYLHIIETSRDGAAVGTARAQLEKMAAEGKLR